jgi:hypothetical protein
MALDVNPDAHPLYADTVSEPDLDPVAQALATRNAAMRQEMLATQEQIARLTAQQDEIVHHFEGLEQAARAALETAATEAARRVAQAVDAAETRVMEGLTVLEDQRREFAKWRDDAEDRLRSQFRDLGDWDEALTEARERVTSLRDMAEASIALASGEFEQRWSAMQHELRDVLATAESDERARFEAFIVGVQDTMASNAGIDPGEIDAVRREIAGLREAANQTIAGLQQAQRIQFAALREEIQTAVAGERATVAKTVDAKLEDARRVFLAQVQSLQEWQQQVGHDVAALKATAAAAEASVRDARATLRAELQQALTTARGEIDLGVSQARVVAQSETSALRAEQERRLGSSLRQLQSRQALLMIIAVLALIFGVGSAILPFLHSR